MIAPSLLDTMGHATARNQPRQSTFKLSIVPMQIDNKHVVFGRVLDDGMLVVRKIENVATGKNNKPNLPCVITECGEY